ncbi:sortase [uncultured Clostridium sp.]|uniref:sortase n=1 Tax=uncultured Clostridium sp. TaxID=59620 RepID=UPI0026359E65|nr:sortase [uncultured Clostridium sp.]
MEKRKIKNKSWFIIIGSFLFLIGLSLIGYDYFSNKNIKDIENNALNDFYKHETVVNVDEFAEDTQVKEEVKEQVKIEYIAVLKIPKINLERGLVNPNSYLNNVNYNVEIVKGSSMPDQENGNVILAGHSGSARISYFKKLDNLSLGDMVYIDYNSKLYSYKVVDIYDIDKTGKAEIIRDKNKSTLTLITCRHNTKRQIVIICELES